MSLRYIALIRGINVGGRNKLAMADLRRHFSALGFADVASYLASGNVLFRAPRQPLPQLAQSIEQRLALESGSRVAVLVRTPAQLADVVRRNPLGSPPPNPSRFFVAFFSRPANPRLARQIEARAFGEDRVWISGAEAFLWCPGGFSLLALLKLLEDQLGVTATTRTWNTVNQLVRLTTVSRAKRDS